MKKILAIMLAMFLIVSVGALAACNVNEPPKPSEVAFDQVYNMALERGYTGTMEELIEAFKGDSAYQIAVNNGYRGTETQWLSSLVGARGADGTTPHIGENGHWFIGAVDTGVKATGDSAYEIWLANGHNGTEEDFLNWLKGTNGIDGAPGNDGKSAYEIWLNNGHEGTEEEFLIWLKGNKGDDGKSAYEIWLENNHEGTEEEFLEWLKGEGGQKGDDGDSAYEIWLANGNEGSPEDFLNWLKGQKGDTGKSAYEIWLNNGHEGTEEEFLEWLKGEFGQKGDDGDSAYEIWLANGNEGSPKDFLNWLKGQKGDTGKSAYEIWLNNGHEGTEEQFLIWLRGNKGNDGDSAYEIWLANGNEGSPKDFLNWLKGQKGDPGKSAYEIWLDNGHTGSQTDFLNWLKGSDSDNGTDALAYYPLDDGTYGVGAGNAKFVSNIVIPSTHNGKSVTTIVDSAFENATNLRQITLPDTIVTIGERAFYGASALQSIAIPSSVRLIELQAFGACHSLEGVYITDIVAWCTMQTVGSYSSPLSCAHKLYLNGELVTNLVLPDNLREIAAYSFCECTDLVSVKLPAQLVSISEGLFYKCTALQEIIIPNGVQSIDSRAFYGCVSLVSITIPQSVRVIDSMAITNCDSALRIVYLGTVEQWNNLAASGNLIEFKNKEINCSDGIVTSKSLDFAPVYAADKTTIVGYDVVGLGTFAGDAHVTVPSNHKGLPVVSITCMSRNADLLSVTIPDSVKLLGASAFEDCDNLNSVTFSGVEVIKECAFVNCFSLETIHIPASVLQIEERAFQGCTALKNITVDENNLYYKSLDGSLYTKDGTKLLQYALGTNLSGFCVPNGVTTICASAFMSSGLAFITLPETIIRINDMAFNGCSNLLSVNIPVSVVHIGHHVFFGCIRLVRVNYDGDIVTWDKINSYSDHGGVDSTNAEIVFKSEYHVYLTINGTEVTEMMLITEPSPDVSVVREFSANVILNVGDKVIITNNKGECLDNYDEYNQFTGTATRVGKYAFVARFYADGSNITCVSFSTILTTEAEILAAAALLQKGESIEDVTLKGTIVAINTPYSNIYRNITVTMEVGEQKTAIQCFRLKDGAELMVGCTIRVSGTLTVYDDQTEKGLLEFGAGCTYELLDMPKDYNVYLIVNGDEINAITLTCSKPDYPGFVAEYYTSCILAEGDYVIIKDNRGKSFANYEPDSQMCGTAGVAGEYNFYFKIFTDGGNSIWVAAAEPYEVSVYVNGEFRLKLYKSTPNYFVDAVGLYAGDNVVIRDNRGNVLSNYATPYFNGTVVASGQYLFEIMLDRVGNATVDVGCTGSNFEDDIAELIALSVSSGALTPEFNSAVHSYRVDVPAETESILISATARGNATIISGTGIIQLATGTNLVEITVLAYNRINCTVYSLEVVRADSSTPSLDNSAWLTSLSISNGTLSPVFVPEVFYYTATVPYEVASVMVSATAKCNRMIISGIGMYELVVGVNVLNVVVVAEDGKTTRTYTIMITRAQNTTLSDVALLDSLTIAGVTLSPKFNENTFSYYATVPNDVAAVTVQATAQGNATILSGTGMYNIEVGANLITIVVLAEDGKTTRTYTIMITRAQNTTLSDVALLDSLTIAGETLSPAFDEHTFSYTATVPNEVAAVTIHATAKCNGMIISGIGMFSLYIGSNVVVVQVLAENGINMATYTIAIIRESAPVLSSEALLESLTLSVVDLGVDLKPAFSATTYNYTATVGNNITSVQVIASAKGNATIVSGTGTHNLTVGLNTLEIVVMAEDGTQRPYTVVVTRELPPVLSSEAKLASLLVSGIELDFDADDLYYTATVASSVTSVTVTAEAKAPATLLSGNGAFELTYGANTLLVKVQAEDGTIATYTIVITRAAEPLESIALLSSITFSDGTLSPAFDPATFSYTATVANSVASVTVSATAADKGYVISGTGTHSLAVGVNTIRIVVRAEDGTTATYTITIIRAAPNM